MKHCASSCNNSAVDTFPEAATDLPGLPLYFRRYTSWQKVPDAYWDLARRSGDFFLQKDYLGLLEDSLPGELHFSYLLFYRKETAVGIAYGQLMPFRADQHIRVPEGNLPVWQKWLRSRLHFRVLVGGHMLLTGQHAYYFREEEKALAGQAVRQALHLTAAHWRRSGVEVNAILLKDIPEPSREVRAGWRQSGFHQLHFQPNMVLPIPEAWTSMDDYLEALTSKYRVRYRRALKKGKGIRRHELDEKGIRAYEAELYRLYRQVADGSDFCMQYLPVNYFSELKSRAPRQFRLWAYFKGEQLIGFCTSLQNGQELEAHFLGLDPTQNSRHQLYLNMLYHLISVAIESRASRLIFSRTAMAIKSSVGALAEPVSVLLTHPTNKLINRLIPTIARWITPEAEWRPRHPFGDNQPV